MEMKWSNWPQNENLDQNNFYEKGLKKRNTFYLKRSPKWLWNAKIGPNNENFTKTISFKKSKNQEKSKKFTPKFHQNDTKVIKMTPTMKILTKMFTNIWKRGINWKN